MQLLERIADQLERGEDEQVRALTREAIERGIDARRILDGGLVAGMAVVGARFKAHDIFLPEVLLAARAMYAGLGLLEPLLAAAGAPARDKVVIGSVQGDLHDIGKNLVGILLKGAGYQVVDLGNDVSPERFVTSALDEGASVIGMSALLTTTMPVMKQVVDMVRERSGGSVKTIVGGAPVTAEYAREIGADAYGYDAANAIDQVKRLLAGS